MADNDTLTGSEAVWLLVEKMQRLGLLGNREVQWFRSRLRLNDPVAKEVVEQLAYWIDMEWSWKQSEDDTDTSNSEVQR